MRVLAQAEAYLRGAEALPASRALRLAARLDKARAGADRTDQGLLEVARERVLVHLLGQKEGGLRLAFSPQGKHQVVIRGPKGDRAPSQLMPLDHIPAAVLAELDLEIGSSSSAEEAVDGIVTRPVDAAAALTFEGMTAADCAAAAHTAEAEYDYDRAANAWRLAVVRSKGDLAMVAELVRFLGDLYADYEEIADLLSSPALDLQRSPGLRLRLADALYQADHGDEAADAYEELEGNAGHEEALVLRRLGDLDQRRGDLHRARTRLERSVALDAGNDAARRLLDRVKERLQNARQEVLDRAEAAREAGDGATASALCAELRNAGQRSSRLARLESALEDDALRDEAGRLLDEARALLDAGDARAAATAVERAQATHQATADAAAEWVAQALRAAAEQECEAQTRAALKREADGDLIGALLSWSRARETGAQPQSPTPLYERLARFEDRQQTHSRPTERQLEGLAALHEALGAFDAQDWTRATAQLAVAQHRLKGDPEMGELAGRVEARRNAGRALKRARHLKRAEASEAAGDLSGALAALERALSLGADVNDARKRIKATMDAAADTQRRREHLDVLEAAGHWWRLKRELAADAAPELVAMRDRATAEIERSWTVQVRPTPEQAARLAWSAVDLPHGSILAVDEQSAQLWAWGGQRVVVCDLPGMRVTHVLDLPEGIAPAAQSTRLFPDGPVARLLDMNTRTLSTLSPSEGMITERVDLALPAGGDPERLARNSDYDPDSGRLLVLLSGQRGRIKSRVLSLDASTGQSKGEEGFTHDAFALRPVSGGAKRWAVHRPFDASALRSGFYNLLMLDARPRVIERSRPDVPEPLHAFRRLADLGDDIRAPMVGQYWFLEPFTGQVVEASSAIVQMHRDGSVFYQVTDPGTWLQSGRAVFGSFAEHVGSGRILMCWHDQTTYGLCAIDCETMTRAWSRPLPEGQRLLRILPHRGSDTVLALTEVDGERVLWRVDPSSGELSER